MRIIWDVWFGERRIMDKSRLELHIVMCKRNLKALKTSCCVRCPFEEEICAEYPEMKELFENKRRLVYGRGV